MVAVSHKGMRLVSRQTGEYTGPCPWCGDGTDRFHVWTQASGSRPAGRYWCRVCGISGVLESSTPFLPSLVSKSSVSTSTVSCPNPEHTAYYRQLYELVTLWAHRWLMEPANPEPLTYVRSRGLTDTDARAFLLGYALADPQSLVTFLQDCVPELMPYAQEAGVVTIDRAGILRTHWNLCGTLIFPTLANGEVVDLRSRRIGAGQRGRSLAGSPARLTRIVDLSSADLAAMYRATNCPHTIALLRWTCQVLASTGDRSISGTLFYRELETAAIAEGLDFNATLSQAIANQPDPQRQARLPDFPQDMRLLDFQALPPGHLDTLLAVYAREQRRRLSGQPFTSRVEATNGRLILALRQEHLIAQLANPEQPKIILDATAQPALLQAIVPGQPIQLEQPVIASAGAVIQVIGQDWAKTTVREQRRERWYQEIVRQIRPGRRTLIVTTQECEPEVRTALAQRGIDSELVAVEHYGGLRGSNAYRGWDVILAQVYHPNLDALIREGRALFADDMWPLDERIITAERTLADSSGSCWQVTLPTFADSRLAALLEARREAEMVQCALRGRPLDHPDVQITILSNLPLPGLPPTLIQSCIPTPLSNAQRRQQTINRLCAAAQQLLDQGKHLLDATMIASQAQASVSTVRTHWLTVAHRLNLEPIVNRRRRRMPTGGEREYTHAALVRRQIGILATKAQPACSTPPPDEEMAAAVEIPPIAIDQACNMVSITGLIYRRAQAGPVRVLARRRRVPGLSARTIRGPPE